MKKNIFTYLLIIVTLISFILAGCVSKSEKLNELEKNQQQMQKEMTTIEKEANEAKQRAERYEKLTDKYKNILEQKEQEFNQLQSAYTNNKDETLQARKVILEKLIRGAQDSVHLQKRLKRYIKNANIYKEKSQQLDEKAKQTQESVEKTTQEIEEIKKEIGADQGQTQ
ncbi:hypothetical protein ACH24_04660 [Francisella persica ATCC VR-331]|uniref:Lipoprotein n=1 Tax=Francisella persica ATCC VR-331 TaxID=1086726 RepID=A0AAC8VEC7_9GAMM|nr:hypothetical protein [Francisella persica]ALB01933.1 hypothetical protein ACH24_04660 [Francisella persica ATCC VR-331]ANH77187.1 hypothetical protein FSC845_00775 [Francisella persica ATCC VR-331]